MSLSNFPNGVTSFGIPQLQGGFYQLGFPQPGRAGKVHFVDATYGSDAHDGSYEAPLLTVGKAVANAVSHDVIYVFPGTYNEAVTVNKDYLTIIGVRSGYARPDVAPDSGTSRPLLIDNAQGFVCVGMRFVPDGIAVDTAKVEGNGFLFYDCVFDGDAAQGATNALLVLQGDATDDSYTASEGKIYNSLFRGGTMASAGPAIGIDIRHADAPSGVGCSDVEIVGNRFYGNLVDIKSTAAATGGGAGIYNNFLIANNDFMTVGAAYVYGDLDQADAAAATTDSALVRGNYFADEALVAAQFDIATRANVIFTGNYDAAGLVDGSGFN